jgi:hypothetical protein
VELERFCYLDDEDRRLISARRRDYNQLGFAVQVVTVRYLGMFLVLWNTVYMDLALAEVRAHDYPVAAADVARLSPFIRSHIGIDGHYSFHLPDLGGTHRPLRDPDAGEDD